MAAGPLDGVKVLEFAGIGPGPLCGMLFSDMGADVVRIDRKGAVGAPDYHVYNRGRRSVALDLKNPAATEACLRLCEKADLLFEGYRPGVMERLGIGPDVVLARNPKLVYGRMTGWGQNGPLAERAGHDINYIAITGALHAIGTAEKPVAPLSLVGDFGGGAMFLAFGMVAALLHARQTGKGQVVDAAMSDGANYLMGMTHALRSVGDWTDQRVSNIVDGGAPFYDTYCCKDGKWVAIGAIEPQFYALLLDRLGLGDEPPHDQLDRAAWPARKAQFAAIFASRTQQQWCEIFDGLDVCFAPVLNLAEAVTHPHNVAREAFVEIDGVVQPTPAPRFSETPGAIQGPPPKVGEQTASAPRSWGLSDAEIEQLCRAGAM